jgi:dTDP-D-glucose 4,6-dehydratase
MQLSSEGRVTADVQATWAAIGKAEQMLGWRPHTDFRAGVRKREWYMSERAWASQIATGS